MQIAVRLAGGIGDHVLGMRVLQHIHDRFPDAEITIYSDAGGNVAQQEICRMSPFVSNVVPVIAEQERVTIDNLDSLNNLSSTDLNLMRSAQLFIDAGDSSNLFINASRALDVSFYTILASKPLLVPSARGRIRADEIADNRHKTVVMNVAKYGSTLLQGHMSILHTFAMRLLEDPDALVLNVFSKTFDFPHWPEPQRSARKNRLLAELDLIEQMCRWDKRIIPVVDESLDCIAALLQRSRYFIGVDNGVKHLAWALDVPLTMFVCRPLDKAFALIWVPDLHHALNVHDGTTAFEKHCAYAVAMLRNKAEGE